MNSWSRSLRVSALLDHELYIEIEITDTLVWLDSVYV